MRDVSYNAAAKRRLASVKLELSMVSGSSSSAARKIDQVEDAGDEHDAKLVLIHAVTEPIETHVQGLAVLRRHGAVGEPDRALVIAVDNDGRLGWPRSASIWRSSRAMRAAAKTPAISPSATNETTTGMQVELGGDRVVELGFGVDCGKIRRAPHVVDGAGEGTCA
jgi:hypothetical protein